VAGSDDLRGADRTAGHTLHRFGSAIGAPEHMNTRCVARNVAYLRGIRAALTLFDRCKVAA